MTITQDELYSLLRQVELMEDEECLVLSGRQHEWMCDMIYYGKRGQLDKISKRGVELLLTIASGHYTENAKGFY